MSARLLTHLPAFFQLACAFGLSGLPVLYFGRRAWPSFRGQLLNLAGFFGYHFCLFMAFRLAPPVLANLLNYLWPVFLVALTPVILPGKRLAPAQIIGALSAFVGVAFLFLREDFPTAPQVLVGLALALSAAFLWPLYSLLKARLAQEPVSTLASSCLISGVLCLLCHLWLEAPPQEITGADLALLLWMGVGPFGAAFYLWDYAIRRGDQRLIGAFTYLTPVLSTLLLIFGAGVPGSGAIAFALILMSAGSVLGTLGRRR